MGTKKEVPHSRASGSSVSFSNSTRDEDHLEGALKRELSVVDETRDSAVSASEWLARQNRFKSKAGYTASFRKRLSGDQADTIRRASVELAKHPGHLTRVSQTPQVVELAKGHDHVIYESQLEFVKTLGSGAFADVELRILRPLGAKPGSKGQEVAVKQLKPEILSDMEQLQHFVAECAVLRSLEHRNLVRCMGVGSRDTSCSTAELRSLYLVQEYVPGGSLRDLLLREELSMWRLYSYGQAVDICAGIADGLAYLHTLTPEKLVHRDIKANNILLEAIPAPEDGQQEEPAKKGSLSAMSSMSSMSTAPKKTAKMQFHLPGRKQRNIEYIAKIADLGLIKAINMGEGDAAADGGIRGMDDPGATGRTGSLLYMAPEVYTQPGDFARHKYNEKADIYSLAMVMYEVFKREAREPAPYNVLRNTLLVPEECERVAMGTARGERPKLPRSWLKELRTLISECWDQDPAKRPSAQQVLDRLLEMRPEVVKHMDVTGLYKYFS